MSEFDTVVILVNYNGFEDTKACINSIRLSKGVLPFIIVVDNASEDVEELQSLSLIYPLYKLITNQENVGFGKANNVGIKWALENTNAQYIFLLNNDTVILENTIPQLQQVFTIDDHIALTTCKIVYYNNPELVWFGGGNINLNRGKPQTADFRKQATAEGANKNRMINFASGCAMMFKRKALEEIKGFDERFFMYVEDMELCMRLQEKELKIWYTANTYILHKVQSSTNKQTTSYPALHPKNPKLNFYLYHFTKNLLLTMSMHVKGWQWYKFIFNYFAIMGYKNFLYVVEGKRDSAKTFLKAVKDFKKEK